MAVKPPSLRTRMAATALMVSTLTAAVLVVAVTVLLAKTNENSVQSRLDARVAAAAATVVRGPHGVRILEERSRLLDQNVWIFDTSGAVIDGTLPRSPSSSTSSGSAWRHCSGVLPRRPPPTPAASSSTPPATRSS